MVKGELRAAMQKTSNQDYFSLIVEFTNWLRDIEKKVTTFISRYLFGVCSARSCRSRIFSEKQGLFQMRIRNHKIVACFLLLSAVVLASCGSGVGTIPSGTPDHGNGTPAVIPSPSSTHPPIVTAPPSEVGATYAYVHANQLWIALHGAQPVQVTSFNVSGLPDVSWHQPVWSPDDHFLAFILNARPAGQGGGGCPAPDFGANGALYLLNTGTLHLTRLVVPADSGDPLASSPHNGYWQYVFWEDATHLLAWYNGTIGKTSSTAGLYRYDLTKSSLTQVVPLSSLGVATLFNAQKNAPLLLSMRYSSGQLYYQVVTHPFTQQSQLTIYRHSVDHPGMSSSMVQTMGSEAWCSPQQSGPYIKPGWDISPDGAQLVAQMIGASGSTAAASSVQVLNLSDNSTTALFAQLPASMLARDLVLTWGPDSQSVVATQAHLLSQDGPYSATLANPAGMQQYAPNAAGLVAWRSLIRRTASSG